VALPRTEGEAFRILVWAVVAIVVVVAIVLIAKAL
jgi:hypothetical protein